MLVRIHIELLCMSAHVCKPICLLHSLRFLGELKWFSHFVQLKAEFFFVKYLLRFYKPFSISEERTKLFLSQAPEISAVSTQLQHWTLIHWPMCVCTKTLICAAISSFIPYSFWLSQISQTLPDQVSWFPDRASCGQSGACLPWRHVCRCPFRSRIRGRRLPDHALRLWMQEVKSETVPACQPSELYPVPHRYRTWAQVWARETVEKIIILLHIILLHIFCRSARLWWWWWVCGLL